MGALKYRHFRSRECGGSCNSGVSICEISMQSGSSDRGRFRTIDLWCVSHEFGHQENGGESYQDFLIHENMTCSKDCAPGHIEGSYGRSIMEELASVRALSGFQRLGELGDSHAKTQHTKSRNTFLA